MEFYAEIETTIAYKILGHHVADIDAVVTAKLSVCGEDFEVVRIDMTDLDGGSVTLEHRKDATGDDLKRAVEFYSIKYDLERDENIASTFWEQYREWQAIAHQEAA
ncbi:hypothetical protein [Pseudovibrio sp. SPO723]|uniref:hypothetical protein n=1 Tax=Nesiotobacter zosterae TaxID=392721 RepID=UPI0029C5A563|nr:hypothetical protein [Pseudovibrio sp. SPO723]MDX5592541.1 hypothetical protein [Pseudovibrio sp. SPO723]